MTKHHSRLLLFFNLILVLSCSNTQKQVDFSEFSNVKINSDLVQDFCEDPRNNRELNSLKFLSSECELSKNQCSETLAILNEYYDCIYLKNKTQIAKMRSSVFKTDGEWPFGTNGFMVHDFVINDQSFPLKNDLKVGMTIYNFVNLFGIPEQENNRFIFYFEFEIFKSTLILECQDDIVTKITVANNVYNSC